MRISSLQYNRCPYAAMTLIELLSAFFLTVAAMGIGFLILSAAMDTLTQVRTKQQISAESRVALERICKDIMASKTYSSSALAITLNPQSTNEHIWKIEPIDQTPALLHGTAQQLAQEPAQRIAALNVTELSVHTTDEQIDIALTLSSPQKPFKLSKTIQKWANTIP